MKGEAGVTGFPPSQAYSALLNSCIVIHKAKATEKIAVPMAATSAMIDILFSLISQLSNDTYNGNGRLVF